MAEGGTGDDHLRRAQRACGEKRSKLGEGEGEGRTKGGLGGRRGIELSRIPLALAVWRRRSRVGCAIPDRESSSVKVAIDAWIFTRFPLLRMPGTCTQFLSVCSQYAS